MQEKEVVVKKKIDDSTLIVKCPTDSCHACKCSLFCSAKDLEFKVNIPKDMPDEKIKENSKISIVLPTQKTLVSTLLVFALPLFFMFVFLLTSFLLNFKQQYQALLSLLGLALGFLSSFLINKYIVKDKFNPIVKKY